MAKREAGSSPARSRRCKRRVLSWQGFRKKFVDAPLSENLGRFEQDADV